MDLFEELAFNDDDLLDSVEDAKPRIIIEAFCVFNSAVVNIAYPTSQQGWVYRADLGGHSLHRWDLGDNTCIVARHSTCAKAMRPRGTPCRNCIMKKTWRRECKEACNTFFLYALVDMNRTLQALSTLIISTLSPSLQDVALYRETACTEAVETQLSRYDKDAAHGSYGAKSPIHHCEDNCIF